jgi:hypothetical protein
MSMAAEYLGKLKIELDETIYIRQAQQDFWGAVEA